MQNVGAAWLMVSLHAGPIYVVLTDHLRQHERQTQADRELEQRINGCLSGEPMVRHLIDAYVPET
jgi:hypothetical protein